MWPFSRRRGESLTDYCARPDALIGGNRLRLLHDGRWAYPAMLRAIESARSSVHLETYILRDDATGRVFAETLAERARAGVEVRLIFDSVGSIDLDDDFIQPLRNSGVQVLEFRPVAPWRRRWGWTRRDHRKILVVDGRVAFTGGINITDDHAPADLGGGGWRDIHVRIAGPAAHELDRLFRRVWFRETGRWFRIPPPPRRAAGSSLVHVAANQEFLKRFLIQHAFLHAINRARRRIVIANAYFIPGMIIRRALYQARRRGVQVDILVPEHSDVPAAAYASRKLYDLHLRRGLRLHSWQGPMLHAKAMTVDGVWAAVGSYNFTHRSLFNNLEVNVHILDEIFSAKLEASLLEDIRSSKRISRLDWVERPASEKLLERFFFALRHWL